QDIGSVRKLTKASRAGISATTAKVPVDLPSFFPTRLRLCLSNYRRPANVRCQAREHHSIRCLAPKKIRNCPRARSASLLAQPPAAVKTQAHCVAPDQATRVACESKRRR